MTGQKEWLIVMSNRRSPAARFLAPAAAAGYVLVRVQDLGCGIPQRLSRAFSSRSLRLKRCLPGAHRLGTVHGHIAREEVEAGLAVESAVARAALSL